MELGSPKRLEEPKRGYPGVRGWGRGPRKHLPPEDVLELCEGQVL